MRHASFGVLRAHPLGTPHGLLGEDLPWELCQSSLTHVLEHVPASVHQVRDTSASHISTSNLGRFLIYRLMRMHRISPDQHLLRQLLCQQSVLGLWDALRLALLFVG